MKSLYYLVLLFCLISFSTITANAQCSSSPTLTSGCDYAIQYSPGNVYTTEAGMSNYTWSVPAGATVTAGGTTTSSSITITWSTYGATSLSVNYTNLQGCTSSLPTSKSVTVGNGPNLYGPLTACVGTNSLYTSGLAPLSGYTYNWSLDNGGTLTQNGFSCKVDWTTQGGPYHLTVTLTNPCSSIQYAFSDIYVAPSLVMPIISGSSSVCQGVPITYTITNPDGTYGYAWPSNPPNFTTTPNGNTASIIFSQAGNFNVGPIASKGSCNLQSTYLVQVRNSPSTGISTTAPSNLCQKWILTAPSGTGLSYQWYKNSVLLVGETNQQYQTLYGISSDSYQVIVTDSFGCTSTSTLPGSAIMTPTYLGITGNLSFCASGSTTLTAYSFDPTASFQWKFNGSNIAGANSSTYVATQAGNFSVVATNSSSCTATSSVTVTINALPSISVTPAAPTICLGSGVNLTASGATSYTWSPTSTLFPPTGSLVTANPTVTTTYTTTGTDANGCIGTKQVTVTVNPIPTASASNQTICSGANTNIALGNPNNVTGTKFYWTVVQSGVSGASNQGSQASPVAGPIAQLLTTAGSVAGTATYTIYPVGPASTNCVGTSVVAVVTVNPTPNAGASNQSICNGGASSVALTNPNNVTGTKYYWTVVQSGVTGASSQGSSASALTGPIAQTLTLTAPTVSGTATYTIYPVSPATASCVGTPVVSVVTINPIPTASASNQAVCSGTASSVALSNPNNISGTLYYWTVVQSGVSGATAQGSSVSPLSGPIAQVLTATTSSPGTATYTIYPVGPGTSACTGSSVVAVVTVNPIPTVSASSQTICSGTSSSIALGNPNNVTGTKFYWTVVQSGVTGATNQGSQASPVVTPIAQLLTTTGNVAGTATYTIYPVGPASTNCIGTSVVAVVTVNPTPDAGASNQSICNGGASSVALTNPNNVTGTKYYWTVVQSGVTGASSQGSSASPLTGPIAQTLTLTAPTVSGTATYTIYPVSPATASCVGTPVVSVVTVNPIPTAGAVNQTICSGTASSVGLSNPNNIPGTLYYWTVVQSGVSGATAQGSSVSPLPGPIAQTLTTTTSSPGTATYTIYPVGPGTTACTGSSVVAVVTVNPVPTVSASNQTICSGGNSNVALGNPNNVTGTKFYWTVVQSGVTGATNQGSQATPILGPIAQALTTTGNVAGTATYTIYPVGPVSTNCVGTPVVAVVTVNPTPNASASNQSICSGGTSSVALTNPNNVTGTKYYWTVVQGGMSGASSQGSSASPLTGPIAQALTLTASGTSGTATYTIYPVSPATASCVGAPVVSVVTVNPNPTVTTLTKTICSGVNTNITLGSNVVGATFSWTVNSVSSGITGALAGSGPSISQVLTNAASSTGSVVYRTTATYNGCSGAAALTPTATVNTQVGTITPTGNLNICATGTVTLTAGTGSTYSWSNGATSQSITVTSPGGFNVSYTSSTTSCIVLAGVTVFRSGTNCHTSFAMVLPTETVKTKSDLPSLTQIEGIQSSVPSAYPIPADKKLIVEIPTASEGGTTLRLIDATGKTVNFDVLEDGHSIKEFDTSGHANGIYVLIIGTAKETISRKVIIVH